MKQYLLAALLLLSTGTFAQTPTDTLNNESVIKLSKSKVPESVILKKISQSICNFDVKVDALVKLKDNNVNDRVINEMMNRQSNTAEMINPSATGNLPGQNPAFNGSGIYFLKDAAYTSLDPSTVKIITPDSYLFSLKYKLKIDGTEANYQMENSQPEFYFVFDTAIKSLNDPNGNPLVPDDNFYIDPLFGKLGHDHRNRFYHAISPNDFKLIKLDLDKTNSNREFSTKKVSVDEVNDIPFENKYMVGFKYEKISSTTFKIKFDKDLTAGQYCFFYSGDNKISDCLHPNNQNTMKAFDFSIK